MDAQSSYLYHFTGGKMPAIKGILGSGFRISFNDETDLVYDPDGNEVKSRRAIPMVCFCDLPINQIDKHAKFYCSSEGEIFGFGMKRSWATAKRLNPIIYVAPGSYMSWILNRINDHINGSVKRGLALDVFVGRNRAALEAIEGSEIIFQMVQDYNYLSLDNQIEGIFATSANGMEGPFKYLSRFELFYKPTHGRYYRRNDVIEDYAYYFEREWRHIPKLSRIRCCEEYELLINEQIALSKIYNNFLESRQIAGFLDFSHEDLDQIIVDGDASKGELIEHISNPLLEFICGRPINEAIRKDLVSKIFTWSELQAVV